jgi:MYXO-CTERM domain-containing protein
MTRARRETRMRSIACVLMGLSLMVSATVAFAGPKKPGKCSVTDVGSSEVEALPVALGALALGTALARRARRRRA